ncbi:MAG: DUF4396 domain-containing protein [Chloroflexi bacterium]|nr:MAG: DUF4396 domain-containing protein [Chloroflexota bacterium]
MADKRWTGFPFGQGSVPRRAPARTGDRSRPFVANLVIVGVPGALEAGLDTVLFWVTLVLSLGVAFVVTVPVNRELLRRGKGHAAVHRIHEARGRGTGPPGGMNSRDRSEAATFHK